MFPDPLPPPLSFEWSSVGAAFGCFRAATAPGQQWCLLHAQPTSCPGVRQLWLRSGPHLSLFLRHQEKRRLQREAREPTPESAVLIMGSSHRGLFGRLFLFWCFTVCLYRPTGISLRAWVSCLFSVPFHHRYNTLQSMNVSLVAGPIAAHFLQLCLPGKQNCLVMNLWLFIIKIGEGNIT